MSTKDRTRGDVSPCTSRGCYPAEKYRNGKYAVICNEGQAMSMLAGDFSRTGQCNFYDTEDKFDAALPARFAFQVRSTDKRSCQL